MTQKTLEKYILGIISVVGLLVLLYVKSVGNIVFSLLLAILAVGLPFLLGSVVRYKVTPAIDSLNSGRDDYEEFPLYMRVLIWAFIGLVLAWIWAFIIPMSFNLPLLYARVALGFGWKTLAMADGMFQYGWFIIFLIQYVANLIAGFFFTDDSEFDDRFEYRW